MALPTKTEVLQGNYNELGSPWSNVVLHSDITIATNANTDGSPWWGVAAAAVAGITRRLKVYIAGAWQAKALKWHNGTSWVEKELKI